jgi:CRP-like cAMP-binding protein
MVPLATDQVIYRQGEVVRRDALLLLTGRLAVYVESGGARRVMSDVWPGEFVGDAGLFTRTSERTATVVSAAPGWALKITRGLLAENDSQPAVIALEQHLVRTLAKRISMTNKTLQRVLYERSSAPPPSPPPSAPRAERAPPVPEAELTLAQRLSRWWNGES